MIDVVNTMQPPTQFKDSDKITMYGNFGDTEGINISLAELFGRVKNGDKYINLITRIRNEVDPIKVDKLKRQLPGVTVSGVFEGGRKKENFKGHSGFICLDFDKLKDLVTMKKKLSLDPFTCAIFISPSGKGLKLFVRVNSDASSHEGIYLSVCKYYDLKYGIETDKSCKDITRLMFLTHDPDLCLQENSKLWNQIAYYELCYEKAITEVEKNDSFKNGNRNNFIFRLALACKRLHIDQYFCENKIATNFHSEEFTEKEIVTTVKSAYKSQRSENENSQASQPVQGLSLFARVEKYLSSKYEIRLNEVSSKLESRLLNTKELFTELNENTLFRELQLNNLNFPLSKLGSLLQSDFVPTYNPFNDYFEGLGKWDATEEDYIDRLVKYIPVKDVERFRIQFKKMLVRCIACALDTNVFNKQVFVLVHDQQNSGKSTFCRWLCPPGLKEYITENINTDKDSIIALTTNFLINMDELATLSKTEINGLKSFISKDKVSVRLPFGKRAVTIPRRASFIGSTNKDEFLTDETGSVRWLCFSLIGNINFSYKNDININDIWRQAYSLYIDGFNFQLTPEEITANEAANRTFQVTSLEMEIIPQFFSPAKKEKATMFVTASDVLKKIAWENPTIASKCSINAIGKAMKMLGFERDSNYKGEKKYSEKGYCANPA